jgi:hypothetical protein
MSGKRGLKPGMTNNPNGRPKGTVNKRTAEHLDRALIMLRAIEALPRWTEILNEASNKELLELWKDLVEYTQPKLARTQHTDGEGAPLVITVRHSVEPPTLPVNQSQIDDDAPFEVIASAITNPIKRKRPF